MGAKPSIPDSVGLVTTFSSGVLWNPTCVVHDAPRRRVLVGNLYGIYVMKFTGASTDTGAWSGVWCRGDAKVHGIAVHPDTGEIYFTRQHHVSRLNAKGDEVVIAGASGDSDAAGDYVDGHGTGARFRVPCGIAFDSKRNLIVADDKNNRIRVISPSGDVRTLAGSGESGHSIDGDGHKASFSYPSGIAVGPDDSCYVTDHHSGALRKVTPTGTVTTIVGRRGREARDELSAASVAAGAGVVWRREGLFNRPNGIAIDHTTGEIYVADYSNVGKINLHTHEETTVAGGVPGYADAVGRKARFDCLSGLCIIYAPATSTPTPSADADAAATPSAGSSTTTSSSSSSSSSLSTSTSTSSATSSKPRPVALLVADFSNHCVRRVALTDAPSVPAGESATETRCC